jgi:hypothetical protein
MANSFGCIILIMVHGCGFVKNITSIFDIQITVPAPWDFAYCAINKNKYIL